MSYLNTIHVLKYQGVWHLVEPGKSKCGMRAINDLHCFYIPLRKASSEKSVVEFLEQYDKNVKLCRSCFVPYFGAISKEPI
jgi:hypothetical protein